MRSKNHCVCEVITLLTLEIRQLTANLRNSPVMTANMRILPVMTANMRILHVNEMD